MNNKEVISHHGILGQKWGIRRFQNPDGSLTPAGRKRAQKLKSEYKTLTGKKLKGKISKEDPSKKSVKELNDTELKDRISRLRNEKEAISLERDLSSNGKKFIRSVGKDVVAPAAIEAGKNLLQKWFYNTGAKAMGLNGKEVKDGFQELKKSTEFAELKARKAKAEQSLRQTMEQEANRQAKKDQNNKKSDNNSYNFTTNNFLINTSNRPDIMSNKEYKNTGKTIVQEAIYEEKNNRRKLSGNK